MLIFVGRLLMLKPLSFIFTIAIAFSFSPQLIANTTPLTQTEIDRELSTVPQWQQQGNTITRTFEFKNFVEAIDFVNKLVEPAETAAHHPDIAISYNKVTVSLTTHDAGGLTQKDFELAQTFSELNN